MSPMVIRRHTFFLLVAVIYLAVTCGPKLIWFLRSEKTTGIFAFQGHGNALEQLPETASFVYFVYKKDTVWFKSPGGLGLAENTPVPIRFQPNDPEDAVINNFRAIWFSTFFYASLPFILLIVIFLHPQVVPWRSKVVLIPRKPFIKVIT